MCLDAKSAAGVDTSMTNLGTLVEVHARRLAAVAFIIAAGACGKDSSPLQPTEPLPVVSVFRIAESSPERMWVTVSNIGLGRFSYGGCSVRVVRQVGGVWEPLPEYVPVVCTAIAYSMPAGAVRSFNVARPTEDGRYRAEFALTHSNSSTVFRIVSEPFGVGAFLPDARAPGQ